MSILLTLLINPALADMDVSVDIETDGDVNYDTDVDAGGDVNLDVDIDADGDVDVVIDGTDIGNEIQNLNTNLNVLSQDVYGNSENSPDGYLGVLEIYEDASMSSICSDPGLQEYFKFFSSVPSLGFIEHMKWLGYDDEAHINLVWTICQEEKLEATSGYISEQESTWSADRYGIGIQTVLDFFKGAVDWLLGLNKLANPYEMELGMTLDRYFASDMDTFYLNARINEIDLRVQVLENTMEEIASEEYCRGKLETMLEYNLDWVICGDTTYQNHMKSSMTGEDVIFGITPVE